MSLSTRKLLVAMAALLVLAPAVSARAQAPARAVLPDLSGLAWISGDRFLAVHDAKAPGVTRASLVLIPGSPTAEVGHALKLQVQGPEPFDLECVTRIPDRDNGPAGPPTFLLIESGSNQERRRIFRTVYDGVGDTLKLDTLAYLPEHREVEGAAVAWIGDKELLFFADRGHNRPSVGIEWAEIEAGHTLTPLGSVEYEAPEPHEEGLRVVTTLEIDSEGTVYSGTAVDTGDDHGPFRSRVWRIGRLKAKHGKADLKLKRQPQLLATLDGLKVESLAIRETGDRHKEFFVGTDDENYGGVMRSLRIPDAG